MNGYIISIFFLLIAIITISIMIKKKISFSRPLGLIIPISMLISIFLYLNTGIMYAEKEKEIQMNSVTEETNKILKTNDAEIVEAERSKYTITANGEVYEIYTNNSISEEINLITKNGKVIYKEKQ